MPILTNTKMETVANANTVMVSAFVPRARKWVHPRLCGSTISTRMVEPFVIGGSAPWYEWGGGSLDHVAGAARTRRLRARCRAGA